MNYKCSYCDPKVKRGEPVVKSINAETDDYIRDDKGKYYHTECFVEMKRKRGLSNVEINVLLDEFRKRNDEVIQENIERDNFLRWLMDFYDITTFSTYFLKKVNEVRIGKYPGLYEPINYVVLLDIYSHMGTYLNKKAQKKQFKNISQRMNYDLAVVVGNYEDYKRYKEKQIQQEIDKAKIEDHINRGLAHKSTIQKKIDQNKGGNNFSISDVIDDLLL